MISLIIPSLNRIDQMVTCVNHAINAAGRTPVQTIIVAGDLLTLDRALLMGHDAVMDTTNAVHAFNMGAHFAAFDWMCLIGDDVDLLPGWTDAIHEPNKGFIGLNEGDKYSSEYTGHFLLHKDFCRSALGGVVLPPVYASWFADMELCEHAKRAGVYHKSHEVLVRHNHWTISSAAHDETYRRGEIWHTTDGEVYNTRMAKGFPITWEGYL